MRRVAVVAFVVVMALGSTVGVGVAGAQTAPSPTDALCAEDPLAALPPEIAGPLAPLTGLLGQLVTGVCSAIPEGGLPGLPEGGGLPGLPAGGIPGIDEAVATFCGPIEDGLAAVPAPLDALTSAFAPLVDAFCGGGAGAPTDPGELCVPIDTFLGAVPPEFQAPLAPLTDLLGQLAGTLCSLIPGTPEEAPAPEQTPEAPGTDVSDTEASPPGGASGGPGLPNTGGTSTPLAAGAALAALAGALRWGLRGRRS